MDLIERMLHLIDENRERALRGGINCIPSPFKDFRQDFPGIEQGKYYLVSGATKGGKSQIANFLFLYTPILYAYENPDKLRVKIFYFPLEETDLKISLRFTSYLLYTRFKVRISPMDLQSIQEGKIVAPEIRSLIDRPEIMNILNFYKEHVYFISDRNPTGCYKTIKKYAEEAGTIHRKTVVIENKATGVRQEKVVFDYYEPKDPDEYVIILIDHAGKLETETREGRSLTKKETIDKLSEYLMIFRDHYKYTPVLLQQQNSDTVSLEAFKANRIRPTYNGLMDSKNPGQDCSVMIGITNPYNFDREVYMKYNIKELKGYYRAVEVALNREGESNNVLSLYFDGAVNFFTPLPKWDNMTELQKVYKLIQKNNENPT